MKWLITFFQLSKSIANLQRVPGIFCSNDKVAVLSKQSLLDWDREKEQGNLREAAKDKRAKSGGEGSIKNWLRELEMSVTGRPQVIKGGKQNSYDTERPENQWNKVVGEREYVKTKNLRKTQWRYERRAGNKNARQWDATQLLWFRARTPTVVP